MRLTLDDLKRVLIEGSGAGEGVDLDGDILDVTFEQLGYDSLALLETASRLAREYRIDLDDDAAVAASTPRDLLDLANATEGEPA
ncbi:Actinorhodin polyketide synthase acyl carrier protein [Frankia canadensis]|uniref:Actinorhodin polyketide synthase acyl carrier protein n=1 Tax=Frankia canadensis TaxID=1836972 RepID=A0A2I2KLE5_9ACTN|nr:phosphopantetheine-binding protein [Frankia canadensis]SNQ46492.1 Actinorhodin polyketide synthase acyl carrier protein [Frankia canadensis]SOU53782.1 Actinorhodin polyketide synthase acyl carrier protein [Frankia canadensis]